VTQKESERIKQNVRMTTLSRILLAFTDKNELEKIPKSKKSIAVKIRYMSYQTVPTKINSDESDP